MCQFPRVASDHCGELTKVQRTEKRPLDWPLAKTQATLSTDNSIGMRGDDERGRAPTTKWQSTTLENAEVASISPHFSGGICPDGAKRGIYSFNGWLQKRCTTIREHHFRQLSGCFGCFHCIPVKSETKFCLSNVNWQIENSSLTHSLTTDA